MLESMQQQFNIIEGKTKDKELDDRINDLVNDSYGFIYALSNFVSPPLGSLVYMKLGARMTGDFVAIMNLSIGIFLIFSYYGPQMLRPNKMSTKIQETGNEEFSKIK